MRASLSHLQISPRKVRLVANLVKGKSVAVALAELKFLTKRSAEPVAKLISSAVKNASTTQSISPDKLFIKDLQVNQDRVLKRMMPRAFGRGARINKRASRLSVILETK